MSGHGDLKLYYFNRSSCSRKVLCVLYEKNIPFHEAVVDLSRSEQRQPAFLELNPLGKVPVLTRGDLILRESSIINEFLEDLYPTPRLMPTDPGERAVVRLAANEADTAFYPQISLILAEHRRPPPERDHAQIGSLLDEFRTRHLADLERRLAKAGPFMFGELTLADFAFAPGLDNLIAVSGFKLDESSNVKRWLDAVVARPSFQRACR
jgi:glutathione S-transferase